MIEAAAFPFHCILVITDVIAISIPSYSSCFISIFSRVKKRFLTLIVRTVRLYQVNDVKLVANVFSRVSDSEVEPLRIICCLIIILKNQVVRVITHIDCPSQVSRLEPTFKYQRFILVAFFYIVRF